MKYRIVSPRIGTPGDIYEPEMWVNTRALLDAGFIEPADKPAEDHAQEDPKPAKTKPKTQPKE